MTDLLLDRTAHDLSVPGYDLQFVDGVDLIRQRIKQRLLTIQGEWFLNTDIGLPWFEQIIGKGAQEEQVSALLIQNIVETEGVDAVIEFDLTFNRKARKMLVQFRVTALGTEILEELTL